MLAIGSTPGRSGIGSFFSSTYRYTTPDGRELLEVFPDRSWNATKFIAAEADGRELGSVGRPGKNKGWVEVGGETIGQLKSRQGAFSLYDGAATEVGRIDREQSFWFVTWTVIEAPAQLNAQLRPLLLAADAAVQPTGGAGAA
jgi:hypothetical protein